MNLDSIELQSSLDKAIELQKTFKPQQALNLLNQILPKTIKQYGKDSKETAKVYYFIAHSKLDLADYNNAKKMLDDALQIFKLTDSVSVELGDTYMLTGIYFDYMANYDKALDYYDLTKKMYLKLFPLNDFRFAYLYNNMGICIFYKGDIERALAFFNKSLAITIESTGEKNTEVSRDLANLSQCLSELRKSNLAIDKLHYSINIAIQNKIFDSSIGARIHHALALAYFNLKKYNETLHNLNKAYQLRLKHLPKIHPDIASSYLMMALTYVELDELQLAKDYFQEALNIYANLFGNEHTEVAFIHTNLALILLKENNLEAALDHINKSTTIFNYDENIPISAQEKFNFNILKALDTKAQIYFSLWQKDRNILMLKKADQVYADLIYVLNEFRKEFKEEVSKEILAGNFFHIFDNAIASGFSLYEETQEIQYLEETFRRYEYSTSFVLLEGRRNIRAKSIAEIPDSLRQIEQQLKTDITLLEKQKREEDQKEEKDQNKIINLASQIFDLKESLYKVIQTFELNYPRYYRFKYDISIVSIDKLQNQILDEGQTLIEYFVGKENIYVFIISKDLFTVKKIKKDFPLETWIESLRKKITKYQFPFNLDKDYHETLVKHSEALYLKLIAPVEAYFKERIIIVPGGVLAEIPFECLVKKRGSDHAKYKEHYYLIQDYAISYSYSGTLLDEMVSNRRMNSKVNMLAFAPTFNQVDQSSNLRDLLLLPLQFNAPEVNNISKIMGAESVIGEKATKPYFIEHSQKYSILHFATHAKADNVNGDYSFLAFSETSDTLENELLYVKDIYNMPLQSEMITLSACQTGIGENRKGEGIISLARSFSFAGTGNINTSLWNVSDSKTANIMQSFYQNIADGLPKDRAMQQSKQKFISDCTQNAQVHPFFWSAMISIGDMHAMQIPSPSNPFIWSLSIFGFICLGWWWFRNSKLNS